MFEAARIEIAAQGAEDEDPSVGGERCEPVDEQRNDIVRNAGGEEFLKLVRENGQSDSRHFRIGEFFAEHAGVLLAAFGFVLADAFVEFLVVRGFRECRGLGECLAEQDFRAGVVAAEQFRDLLGGRPR